MPYLRQGCKSYAVTLEAKSRKQSAYTILHTSHSHNPEHRLGRTLCASHSQIMSMRYTTKHAQFWTLELLLQTLHSKAKAHMYGAEVARSEMHASGKPLHHSLTAYWRDRRTEALKGESLCSSGGSNRRRCLKRYLF
jgi:hypothetical protein